MILVRQWMIPFLIMSEDDQQIIEDPWDEGLRGLNMMAACVENISDLDLNFRLDS